MVSELGKEFVEKYGFLHPKQPFDVDSDSYSFTDEEETSVLAPYESTPHLLIQSGVATEDDWCDFIFEKRNAVIEAGPLIYSLKEMDQWARKTRHAMPGKKLGKKKRKLKWKMLY